MSSRIVVFGRHAKSSWADPGQTDFERPLNGRGEKDAPLMAKRLVSTEVYLEAIISSSAKRALKTAEVFAAEYGVDVFPAKVLYHAEPDTYLDQLRKLPETVKSVAIFGHNPAMTTMAYTISDGKIAHVPTCGLFITECNIHSWEELEWDKIQFRTMLIPKDGDND